MFTHTVIETAVGELTLLADDRTLCGIYYPHHWHPPADLGERDETGFDEAADQLRDYLDGRRRGFDLTTTAAGSEYQHDVWRRLAHIPYGETVTYGDLARDVGGTPFDVGQAVGRNPLSIVVPCHRVVGKDGALTGYAGGLEGKRFLLDLEQDQHARLF